MSRDLVVALSGGIGGAKLALGLSRILPADNLLVVANVGDDFEDLCLHAAPATDTLMSTLAGLNNTKLGWGRHDETWSFMETLTALGGEDWFRLGDRDLAVHVERTRRLRQGGTVGSITGDLCPRLGVGPRVLKQRLSSCLTPEERRALATIMLEDVLDALSAVPQLAGILVVTVDPIATSLAGRY